MITATGIGVRHAIARALATSNLAMAEATFRVRGARVELDERKRVVRGEATLEISKPAPLSSWSFDDLAGTINADGEHPLMVYIGGDNGAGFFLDIFPVTWDRWLRQVSDRLPDIDPLCPRTGVDHAEALDFANNLAKRLPSAAELSMAWGADVFPWGSGPDPSKGRIGRPRFDMLPEVGLHPPDRHGLFDLGAWLWQLTSEGFVFGGSIDENVGMGVPPGSEHRPLGFRLAQDA